MNSTGRVGSLVVGLAMLTTLQAQTRTQTQTQTQTQQNFAGVEIATAHVAGNVYMLIGAGGNIAASVGPDGVLLVDTQFGPLTDRIVAAIRELSDQPIRFVVNTHVHGDHVGGNGNLNALGATIVARDTVRARMQAADSAANALPTVTFGQAVSFHFNGERVSVIPVVAPAHTDGDSLVYFHGSNVLHTGDVYQTQSFPVADTDNGGRVTGHIDVLNQIMELTTTAPGFLSGFGNAPGAYPEREVGELGRPHDRSDTLIIPGHGRLADEIDLLNFRNMLVIIRDRVKTWAERGMSLDEILALRPAFGWEALYGAETGPRTTRRLIETIYAEVTAE
jgi:glyoxylase-like metal-dependent hydrolase (beta-lactamase superfamily II)